MFGIHLGLSTGVLDAIEENFRADAKRKRREVVSAWLNSSVPPQAGGIWCRHSRK